MNVHTALEKIDELTIQQLSQMVQLCNYEIENYSYGIRNYSPEKMEKYGKPFLDKLIERRDKFANKLAEKGG